MKGMWEEKTMSKLPHGAGYEWKDLRYSPPFPVANTVDAGNLLYGLESSS